MLTSDPGARREMRRRIREAREEHGDRTINAIARRLGMSWERTRKWIDALGIDLTDKARIKRDAKIVAMAKRGENYGKIAAAVNLSKQRIHQILEREMAIDDASAAREARKARRRKRVA